MSEGATGATAVGQIAFMLLPETASVLLARRTLAAAPA